ncbi:probable LRR receptor-like serine/threonine-protein kinase At2g24230 isoform X3 [Phalaenopsis equestris]|uniref:probable LRR receptor-like serine/threonine-protein kinase At2g24230 isoform X3 n=1 Tax=Phalaenopsis equestris TaxID=78828 RepID=UPI0009E492EE|nr:probable LRR receptor-like serine/threonine-protein kinase At2g24230 isoform X3 [Phalaenopsis equestris]
MGSGYLASSLFLVLFFKCLAFQQPNSDGFFLADFLKKMGAKLPSTTSSSVCSWSGVSCDSNGEYVIGFVASDLGLSGSIPENTIGKLSKLQALDLSINNITKLSSDLWGLGSSLKSLNLSMNRIQDSLLNNIGNFGNLESLDLSQNDFFGEIPAGISSMTNLRFLNVSRNAFGGKIPEGIADCKYLVTLDLSVNKLSGSLPAAFKNLSFLDLSRNQIQGAMPDLSGFKSIHHLNVSNNLLQDSITLVFQATLELLEKLPRMELFNFSNNNLTFCAKKFLLERFNSSFIGSQNSCPLAANPDAISSINVKHKRLKLELAITLSVFCVLVGIICLSFACRKSTRSWAVKQLSYKEEQNVEGPYSFRTDSTAWVADVRVATSVPVVMFEKPLLNFTFADLLASTSNFDRGTLLSEGSLGPVYRGILPGGIQVALKVLVNGAALTDQDVAKELERLGRIKHPNIVPLTGYCLAGDQRIAIYEYMENGNLQNLLHDLPLGVQTAEDWSTDTWENETSSVQNITTEGVTTWRFRHRIALGVARALAFLHHGCFPQVVHRDVKASNIYLDSNLEPRLSHFGLEKVVGNDLDEISGGSPGYVPPELSDPENASSSAATPKIDVFGFGVVLFELITGRKPVGETSLVDWARALVKKSQCSLAIDPKIRETGPEKQMEEALRIAYLCTADLPSKRPSMQQIVGLLKDMEPVARD